MVDLSAFDALRSNISMDFPGVISGISVVVDGKGLSVRLVAGDGLFCRSCIHPMWQRRPFADLEQQNYSAL